MLREQIDYLTKKLFGRKSEKTDVISGQIVLEEVVFGQFNEAEEHMDPGEVEIIIKKKPSRKGYTREKLWLAFQRRIVLIDWKRKNASVNSIGIISIL